MPIITSKSLHAAAAPINDVDIVGVSENNSSSSMNRKQTSATSKNEQDLLGLLNEIPSASTTNVAPSLSVVGGGNDLLGLLESNVDGKFDSFFF